MNKILIAGAAGALVLGGVAIAQTNQGETTAQPGTMQTQQPGAMQTQQPDANAGETSATTPGAMSAAEAAEDTAAAGSDMQYAGERG
jgi:hypothetical protein